MRPGISEFSYGYALTEELVGTFRNVLIGAPMFPSLREEGRPNGGYDVRLNRATVPLFLQFKLSEEMVRTTCFEIASVPSLSVPFFRIQLMPRRFSSQHDALLQLDNGANEVYYAAPRFSKQDELNHHYTNRQIIQHSFFITPQAIGEIEDGANHHIAVERNANVGWRFSKEPKTIKNIKAGETLVANIEDRLDRSAATLGQTIDSLFSQMRNVVLNLQLGPSRLRDQLFDSPPSISLLSTLSNIYFESQLLFITSENDSNSRRQY